MKFIILPGLAFLFCTMAQAQNVGIGEPNPTGGKLQVKAADSAVLLLQNPATMLNTKTAMYYKSDNNYSGGIATIQTAPSFYRMGLFTYGSGASSGLIERLSILDGGNVGIGTINPTAKLEVAGTLKINDGSQAAGKVLTSDANGMASWQETSAPNGSVGFGTWGDCSMNNISEYNPVADTTYLDNDINYFGTQVSISGNYAIVGAEQDQIGANANQGSASIYQFTNGTWTLMQKITDPLGTAGDYFGCSVAISGNYAIVGARFADVGANAGQGTAIVYTLSGGNWVLTQRLTDPTGAAYDGFGHSIAVSGNYAVIGAPYDDDGVINEKGSLNIYQLIAGSWIYKQKILDGAGAVNNLFGYSVAISGNYLIASSSEENADRGAAMIYRNSGSSWVLMSKLTNTFGAVGENFGTSVAIAGNSALVGIPHRKIGVNANQGAVTCFQLVNNNWTEIQTISRSNGLASENFGENIAISGNYAMVNSNDLYNVPKSVSVYQRIGISWQKVQEIKDPGENAYYSFGKAVAIDAATKRFMIGSPYFLGFPRGNGIVVFGKLNF